MPSTLWEFQSLFFELRDGPADGWGDEQFQPWLDVHPHVLAELHELGRPDSRRVRIPRDRNHYTALEGLYALSRLVEVLVSPFQPDNPDPELLDWTNGTPWWQGTAPDTSAWPRFCAAIGAAPLAEAAFHPFFHEIVSVRASDDADEPPSLIDEYWPGAVVGSLLLTRAGVAIRAGAHHLDGGVATRSALYWAWWRRNRRAVDLSHGWGHNSQWRTDFRRDYVVEDQLYYNVDADPTRGADTDLDEADRLDLLRYRCGIRTDLGADQWPYNDTFVERARTRRGPC